MRAGLTLIELLVVLSIVGILAALLSVGIGASRETARQIECVNKMRQCALAIQQHESDFGTVPSMRDTKDGSVVDPWISLDPYLELRNQRRRMALGIVKQAPIYSCPSDTVGGKNYRMNHGSGVTWDKSLGKYYSKAGNGPVIYGDAVRFSSVLDGLSNTAVLSERLCGIDYRNEKRSIGMGPFFLTLGVGVRKTATAEYLWMENNWQSVRTFDQAGLDLNEHGFGSSVYNHSIAPNSELSCTFSGGFSTGTQVGFVGPTSAHRGGVVVALLDGSVHTQSPTIDSIIWSKLGSVQDAR